ncbi:uncharacterized protein si:ch211-113e8.11 [Hemiscyllium ocellatum]|uniref:uncharacterized protein si:ch211-113e8.11 n=1 Tax=Hemiscyllium ocellatum TaxID=170820 RepID=UPI0029672A59|nr:uncharacterized protein si:ch211-113e8.11 [Hemiscyllium ocellatum]
MAALVADYSSSESEGETECGSGERASRTGSTESGLEAPPAEESGTEERCSEGGGPQERAEEGTSNPMKLPPPELEGGLSQTPGVFANPFAQERRQRLSLLEKHVRLTAGVRTEEAGGGSKICLAYRKDGRCRYGSNCKFAHDSDLPDYRPGPAGSPSQENGEVPMGKSGRKRPGLSAIPTPPKRIVKNYWIQHAKEGPGLL